MNVSAVSATSFTGRSVGQIAHAELKQARKQYAEAFVKGTEADKKAATELLHEAQNNLKGVIDNAKSKEIVKDAAKAAKGKTGVIIGLSAAALAAIAGIVYYKNNKAEEVQAAAK